LLGGSPNDAFGALLTELGVFTRIDLSGLPPPAALGRDGDRLVLAGPGLGELFAYVREHKKVTAFSLAPAADLKALDGRVFQHQSQHLRVRVVARPEKDGPYHRRLIQLEHAWVAAPDRLDDRAPAVIEREVAGLPLLFAAPVRVAISQAEAERLFARQGQELAAANGLVLPATHGQAPANGYHSDDRARAREGLRTAAGLVAPLARESAAVAAWRLHDEPLLRDAFLEGAAMHLGGRPGEPTHLRLAVADGADREATASYRARFFLDPDGLPGPSWAPAVARAVRADVEGLAAGGLRLEPATTAACWSADVPAQSLDPGAPADGTWQEVERVVKTCPRRADRALAQRLVLNPAWPPKKPRPDHDYVERLFLANFAHPGGGDALAWRQAWFPALMTALAERRLLPPEEVLADELASGRARLEEDGTACRVSHAPTTSPGELARWGWLLPLGTVLTPDDQLRLDASSRLDDGRRLGTEPADGEFPLSRAFVARPGRVVQAGPFSAWQAWLLARPAFRGAWPGVEFFEAGRSLLVHAGDEGLEARAQYLLGLTDAGQPVVLWGEDGLSAALPRAAEQTGLFDAAIEVDPDGPEDEPAKYALRVTAAGGDGPRPAVAANALDLGRFLRRGDGPPRMVARPAVRTLAALRPLDAAWREYVGPLTRRLDELLRKRSRGDWPSDFLFAAYASAVSELADGWLTLPLDELATSLAHLARLATWRPEDGPRDGLPPDVLGWRTLPVASWPEALAALSEPVLAPPRSERPLVLDADYAITWEPDGLALRLLRGRGAGLLRFRLGPAARGKTFTLRGPGVAQQLNPAGPAGDCETVELVVNEGGTLALTPRPAASPTLFFIER
jgi:hypothetical protein